MAEVNHIRVNEGESVELPSNISESAVSVWGGHSDWLYVVEYEPAEDEGEEMVEYTRHIDILTSDPEPPKAKDVIVLRLNEQVFDYLVPQ